MAEKSRETQKLEAAASAAEVVVSPAEEKSAVKGGALPPAAAEEGEEPRKVESAEEEAAEAGEGEKEGEEVPLSVSFKEESNVVAELEEPHRKALDELKELVRAALDKSEFTRPPAAPKEEGKAAEKAEEPVVEAPKAEEPAAEVPKVGESPAESPAKVEEEAPTEETKQREPLKPEESAPPAKEEQVATVTAADEKDVPVDADGAKAAQAIEETVIPAAGEAIPVAPAEEKKATPPPPPEEVSLWGVPLLGDERSDTILLKFLRARDFKVKDALALLKDTVIWRKEFGIEGLLEEDLGVPELEKVVFMHGHDKKGHPVCYNVYGEFQGKELYRKALSDEEKRKRFLRWRIQFLEKGIRQHLDFSPSGVCSMVQVTDLKNSPGPGRWELLLATKQLLALLQDNYPELVAKQVFINVPWWYLAFNRMISPFLTQRTKSKFVFAGPSKSSEALFKYIAPEQVPIQYGGLSKDDKDFTISDAATEVTIKPSTKHIIEIPVSEACVLVWELRVLGWDVSYGAEFIPAAVDGYTVIVQKARPFTSADEPFVKNSFKTGEPGKIVLTVDNSTSRKKKLLYRYKAKTGAEST